MRKSYNLCLSAAICGLIAFAVHAAPVDATYAKILVGDDLEFIVEFRGKEMRIAASAEALSKAPAITATRMQGRGGVSMASFPMTTLPISKDKLPANTQRIQGMFSVRSHSDALKKSNKRAVDIASAQWRVEGRGKDSAKWELQIATSTRLAASADKADTLRVTGFAELTIEVIPILMPRGWRTVGIGIRLKADGAKVKSLLRKGKRVPMTVEVLDEKGKSLAKSTDDLSKFGFA
jgi:hypothetical protein